MVTRKVANQENDPSSYPSMRKRIYDALKVDSAQSTANIHRWTNQDVLRKLAIHRIDWFGLPPKFDSWLVESLLLDHRQIALYRPETVNEPLVCLATGSGPINNVGTPSHWNLQSLNGDTIGSMVPDGLVAVCDPRFERIDAASAIAEFIELSVEFRKAMTSNLAAQKTPVIVLAPEELRLSAENMLNSYVKGEPSIFSYPGMDPQNALKALNFKVDYYAGDMLVDRRQAWNDLMTVLGIDNSNQDKRERLVVDEVGGNNQQIEFYRLAELQPRRSFAEKANALYQMDIDVQWNMDIQGRIMLSLTGPDNELPEMNQSKPEAITSE